MSSVATVYAQALYGLARDEGLDDAVLHQMTDLDAAFRAEPDYIRLLCAANLSKAERCRILDDSFRGKFAPCLLNFMKILTEKGYMRHFSHCCKAYKELYNEDRGILEVRAVTATALSNDQFQRLQDKLSALTGRTVSLINTVNAECLGGVRLDYDGKRLDDTLLHRLESIRSILSNTVL